MTAETWAWEPLTPTSFLRRAAAVFPNRTAIVDKGRIFTYAEFEARSQRLAGGLHALARGRPVAVLAHNSHVVLEAHHGVPWSGSPLVVLNTRLSADELTWIVRHSEAPLLIHDTDHAQIAAVIVAAIPRLRLIALDEYEDLIERGTPYLAVPDDEQSLLSINYTSGTTGRPKGVMYHHRGAYLQALAMVHHAALVAGDVYLWTLPMFHCNGWCFPWAVTAAGAKHVCLDRIDTTRLWHLVNSEGVTVLCGAPTVLTMIANAPEATPVAQTLRVLTGGSPPAPALIRRLEGLNISVTHLYGLTETFGPVMVNDWHPEWDQLDAEKRAILAARQGVANVIAHQPRVVDSEGHDVAPDGKTTGEIALRGNDVMLGYLKDPVATAAAIPDGWFRTGDLAVMHPDGYVEIKDRSKDLIISGGENISSVEVEAVLAEHPAVLECAVVARPDPYWGETPMAFVTLRDGAEASEAELIAWARDRLAHFKVPKSVAFCVLPKTSTGKVKKFTLRREARCLPRT